MTGVPGLSVLRRLLHPAAWALVLALSASCGGGGPAQACPTCLSGTGAAGDGDAGAAAAGSGPGDGTSVAGGVGSGGTGIDGGGVGSGGTGMSADAVGIGSVDGFGSIIVNGVRHEVADATLDIAASGGLQLGMTVRVRGRVDSERAEGAAAAVSSSPELRGTVLEVDPTEGSFSLLGTRVSVDPGTTWAGMGGPADLAEGMAVLAYGLPGPPGQLRATRIERLAGAAAPVLTGTVQDLQRAQQRFRLGGLLVDYASAGFGPGLPQDALADGLLVRVSAQAAPGAGAALAALTVEPWHTRPLAEGQVLSLSGLVTDAVAASRFQLLGVTVDGAAALFTGGTAQALWNGVRVDVRGAVRQGVLVAERIHLRRGPGVGAPAQFSARGAVGQFKGPHDFRVQGQPIDASGPAVRFIGGALTDLGNGRRVRVTGSRVSDGMLRAEEVVFEP